MRLQVKYHLFDTSQGKLVSEGVRYQMIQVDDEVDLDKHESLKIVSSAVGKAINRNATDIKILGYKLV
ncbi:hypothetical protein [Sporosarcina sp. USHLN248]|uniref:hypothetical protein n=1 Tax=Sporosarcina sp. USHLN248 TaxID=3081300 RepID=UPI00301ABBCA